MVDECSTASRSAKPERGWQSSRDKSLSILLGLPSSPSEEPPPPVSGDSSYSLMTLSMMKGIRLCTSEGTLKVVRKRKTRRSSKDAVVRSLRMQFARNTFTTFTRKVRSVTKEFSSVSFNSSTMRRRTESNASRTRRGTSTLSVASWAASNTRWSSIATGGFLRRSGRSTERSKTLDALAQSPEVIIALDRTCRAKRSSVAWSKGSLT
mmetsp:Transcript_32708/g.90237  ORF Transcript_32708/g.90237 Transcript_32708/m.90237 type:complete len:208 (-) Transcript_32708:655-1278(-)